MTSIARLSLARNEDVEAPPVDVDAATRVFRELCEGALTVALERGGDSSATFMAFEREIREHLFAIGRSLLVEFLVVAGKRIDAAIPASLKRGGRTFRRAPAQTRSLNTMFGVVRYTRGYMRQVAQCASRKRCRGFHPLDAALGLGADRVSMNLLSLGARMATKMSYADARHTTSLVVPTAPSTEVIEQTVLGLGHFTEQWFAQRPTPEGDGEVLVAMVDSKGAPMAGDEELARRRGPRRKSERAPSPRHRGRVRRRRHAKKPRRKKGDGSKNARMATMVLMYTLKRKGGLLLGPINRFVYASFAPKEHAFQIARREANKRGFREGTDKLIQFVTDGDVSLQIYIDRYFPTATQTIDIAHCVEKLWMAGEAIFEEGTREHRQWHENQRQLLRRGRVQMVIDELRRHQAATPKTGPGAKYRHLRLRETINYFEKRIDRMNYGQLIAKDMEISTGRIEGAIKNVIGKRCDHGGMRWIKDRAEAVLQLRCIEMNGDWDAFIDYVHAAQLGQSSAMGIRPRLQARTPRPLPQIPNTEFRRQRRRETALKRNQRLAIAA